jgi:Transposase, Mutator family
MDTEKPPVAVIQEAWVGGVSTRRVDALAQAMGLSGISKPTVSKLCKDIDERVGAFLDRPLPGEWPYLWLDATCLRQREGGRIVSVAAMIAAAVDAEGKREIAGLSFPRRATRASRAAWRAASARAAAVPQVVHGDRVSSCSEKRRWRRLLDCRQAPTRCATRRRFATSARAASVAWNSASVSSSSAVVGVSAGSV